MESKDPEPLSEQDIERLLQEISLSESESDPLEMVGGSFQEILERLTAEGLPAEQILAGVKHGLGVAFGHHLGVLTLERLATVGPTKEDSEPAWDMTLKLPQAQLNEVRAAWPELRNRLEKSLGFCPANLRLEVSPETWVICQGGMILAEQVLPETWFEPLVEYLQRWMYAFLTLDDVEQRLISLKESSPAISHELNRQGISVSAVHEVLQILLAESVSIAEFRLIVTQLLIGWSRNRDPIPLAEVVRSALAPWLCRQFQSAPMELRALALSEDFKLINESVAYRTETGLYQYFPPSHVRRLRERISDTLSELDRQEALILFTDRESRPALGALCSKHFPHIGVLSWSEVHPGFEVEVVATVEVVPTQS